MLHSDNEYKKKYLKYKQKYGLLKGGKRFLISKNSEMSSIGELSKGPLPNIVYDGYEYESLVPMKDGSKQNFVFSMDKLNDRTIKFWKEYSIYLEKNTQDNAIFAANITPGLFTHDITRSEYTNATGPFLQSIQNYSRIIDDPKNSDYDIWICYVTKDGDIHHPSRGYKYDEIIMAVSVMLYNDKNKLKGFVPISSHMGIHKNIFTKLITKQNTSTLVPLSILLHSYAAYVSKKYINTNLSHMYTPPMSAMRELILKHYNNYAKSHPGLDIKTIITVGTEKNRTDSRLASLLYNSSNSYEAIETYKKLYKNIINSLNLQDIKDSVNLLKQLSSNYIINSKDSLEQLEKKLGDVELVNYMKYYEYYKHIIFMSSQFFIRHKKLCIVRARDAYINNGSPQTINQNVDINTSADNYTMLEPIINIYFIYRHNLLPPPRERTGTDYFIPRDPNDYSFMEDSTNIFKLNKIEFLKPKWLEQNTGFAGGEPMMACDINILLLYFHNEIES